jgi:hypothetical protein
VFECSRSLVKQLTRKQAESHNLQERRVEHIPLDSRALLEIHCCTSFWNHSGSDLLMKPNSLGNYSIGHEMTWSHSWRHSCSSFFPKVVEGWNSPRSSPRPIPSWWCHEAWAGGVHWNELCLSYYTEVAWGDVFCFVWIFWERERAYVWIVTIWIPIFCTTQSQWSWPQHTATVFFELQRPGSLLPMIRRHSEYLWMIERAAFGLRETKNQSIVTLQHPSRGFAQIPPVLETGIF